jgi:predicted P-loop ATPase
MPSLPKRQDPASVSGVVSETHSSTADTAQPSAVVLSAEHRQHLLQELGADGLKAAIAHGARSIDANEARRLGFHYSTHRTGGLLLPFGGDFAQLRCDNPPTASNGDSVKYLSRKGAKQQPATFGTGNPTAATEGWKDGLRLHLETGATVQAIAGVTAHRSLAHTVTRLIYDADAKHNPSVWSQLIAAGLERPTLRLGFFPSDAAGPKGGACEFFGNDGEFEAIQWHKARALLLELHKGWSRDLRPDWQPHAIRHLARLAVRARIAGDGIRQLAANAAKAIGLPVDRARRIAATEIHKAAPPPKPAPPSAPPAVRIVSAAGKPPEGDVNAGDWATALGAGIGSRLRRNLLTHQIELDGDNLDVESEELLFVTAQQAGWNIRKPDCYDGTRAVALNHAFHPVRDYLDRIAADPSISPVELGGLAASHLGVDDELSAAMIRCLLIGAVARIHQPGCTAPGVVVLRGDQGIGKSEFWKALGGPFYVVSRHEDGAKDQTMAMHSSWIYDLDELDKVTTAKQAAGLRSTITTPADTLRLPYARRNQTFPRQFVIVGAVNGDGFLTDPEGNRRYWVIDCPQKKGSGKFIDGPGAARKRDGIWKAAVLAYRAGQSWQLTYQQQNASNERNGQWEVVDEWEAALTNWAENTSTTGGFTTREAIVGAGLRQAESVSKPDEMRASTALKRAGFHRSKGLVTRETNVVNTDGVRQIKTRDRVWTVTPAQPAQPCTTSEQEVVQAQNPDPDSDQTSPAQPAQPFSESFVGEGYEGEGRPGEGVPIPLKGFVPKMVVQAVQPAENPQAAADLSRTTSLHKPASGCAGCADPTPATTGAPIRVKGEPGWRLPGTMPRGEAPTVKVLVVDPKGCSRQVERRLIEMDVAA